MIPILIADTFGDRNHVTERWADVLGQHAWQGIHYSRSAHAPQTAPHHHGWWCFSQMWPVLYDGTERDRRFVVYLHRFIDDPSDQWADGITELSRRLYEEYGCLVRSFSWGGQARGSQFDGANDTIWMPWVDRETDLMDASPRMITCMSSGNDGPRYGGSPIWQFGAEHVWSIGSVKQGGVPSSFTSRHREQFTCVGGQAIFGAHPDKVAYRPWDGTSGSSPRAAALSALYMDRYGADREVTMQRLQSVMTRPSEVAPVNRSDVWGWGNLEPIYQAESVGQWERLRAPGPIRQAMARANIFRPLTPLPQPQGSPQ